MIITISLEGKHPISCIVLQEVKGMMGKYWQVHLSASIERNSLSRLSLITSSLNEDLPTTYVAPGHSRVVKNSHDYPYVRESSLRERSVPYVLHEGSDNEGLSKHLSDVE